MPIPMIPPMREPEPAKSLVVLARDACLQALHGERFGRIAVSDGALPMIVPVAYVLDGEAVTFRVHTGSLLDRACRNTVVAFEIDDVDPISGTGWSVTVVGVANAVSGEDLLHAQSLTFDFPGVAAGNEFIRIVPGTITGRALRAPERSESSTTG